MELQELPKVLDATPVDAKRRISCHAQIGLNQWIVRKIALNIHIRRQAARAAEYRQKAKKRRRIADILGKNHSRKRQQESDRSAAKSDPS
jgi:hypothetical protein